MNFGLDASLGRKLCIFIPLAKLQVDLPHRKLLDHTMGYSRFAPATAYITAL